MPLYFSLTSIIAILWIFPFSLVLSLASPSFSASTSHFASFLLPAGTIHPASQTCGPLCCPSFSTSSLNTSPSSRSLLFLPSCSRLTLHLCLFHLLAIFFPIHLHASNLYYWAFLPSCLPSPFLIPSVFVNPPRFDSSLILSDKCRAPFPPPPPRPPPVRHLTYTRADKRSNTLRNLRLQGIR